MFLCPLCRRRLDLVAKSCGCGFDLAANDPAGAVACARQDLAAARRLLAIGLAGAAGTVGLAVLAMPRLAWLYHQPQLVRMLGALPMLVPLAALYGLGRGLALWRDAHRRLATGRRMQRLPVARIV